MTRRARHWIAVASVAAAAAGGFAVTTATSGSHPVYLPDERQAGAEQAQAPSSTGTVITIHGDTTKDPFVKSGWADGTQANTNIILTGITFNGLD
jgi:hypothetical protein